MDIFTITTGECNNSAYGTFKNRIKISYAYFYAKIHLKKDFLYFFLEKAHYHHAKSKVI